MAMERVAVRAIFDIDGKVLLGKRGRGVGQGQYALLGGKPDIGESLEEAVVREVKEESGLDFLHPILFTQETNDTTKPGESWHTYYFLGQVLGQLVPKIDEVELVLLVGPDDLLNIDIAFNHKEILEKYFASV